MRCAITCLVNARYSQTTCIRHESHVSPDLSAAAAQTREPSVIYNAISPCVPEWFNVCLRVYLQDIFGAVSSIVRMYLPVCVLSRLTRRNGYPPVLSCCIQTCWPVYTQCESDLGTTTKLGHHTEKTDDSVQPRKYEILPFVYVYVCLCLRKNNIGRAPPSEVNVRAR